MASQIHLIDETWIKAEPSVVCGAVADPANWPVWWPSLTLRVTRDRGLKGMQWAADGQYRGSVELWCEPFGAGVILHHYLRLDPSDGIALGRRRTNRVTRELAWHSKRSFWALKDRLEQAGR